MVMRREKPYFCNMERAKILFTLLFVACTSATPPDDDRASASLSQARALMVNGDYDAARDTILALRREYPTALSVRRAAILTLDSVELFEARQSLQIADDSLQAAEATLGTMSPRVDGHTNDEYYAQQRLVRQLRWRVDELAAKVKFYLRKLDMDQR